MGWAPSPSHKRLRRKPKKHQADSAVRKKKSAIIDLRHKNMRFSDNKVNASLGTKTGAARASTSNACSPGPVVPVR
jgi:hypothetical protein